MPCPRTSTWTWRVNRRIFRRWGSAIQLNMCGSGCAGIDIIGLISTSRTSPKVRRARPSGNPLWIPETAATPRICSRPWQSGRNWFRLLESSARPMRPRRWRQAYALLTQAASEVLRRRLRPNQSGHAERSAPAETVQLGNYSFRFLHGEVPEPHRRHSGARGWGCAAQTLDAIVISPDPTTTPSWAAGYKLRSMARAVAAAWRNWKKCTYVEDAGFRGGA